MQIVLHYFNNIYLFANIIRLIKELN